VQLNFEELRNLLVALDQTDIAELTLKSTEFELTVRKGVQVTSQVTAIAPTVAAPGGVPSAEVPQAVASPVTTPPAKLESAAKATVDAGAIATASVSPAPTPERNKWVEITSPMVGTFYRSPAPDEPPFVDVGDRIRNGQTVCIIEAMKLMNELEAEVSGEIMEILVQNAQPVEYGQVLMRVNPG
jgi:acetyl-CoA carboxylase biotin carboxyl carrier protein